MRLDDDHDAEEEVKLVAKNAFEIRSNEESDQSFCKEGGEVMPMRGGPQEEQVKSASHFDVILDEIGGFGVYQLVYFNVIVMGMVSGAFVLYSMNYFELEPALECLNQQTK